MSLLWRHHEKKVKAEPEVVEPSIDYPNHTGGGWYELSNGERVQGKKEAQKEEKALTEKK